MESGEALPERSDRECDDKEETRRVSDAANDKIDSGEALPERSDRECDETEVPGAEASDVTHCWLQKPHEGVRRQGAPA